MVLIANSPVVSLSTEVALIVCVRVTGTGNLLDTTGHRLLDLLSTSLRAAPPRWPPRILGTVLGHVIALCAAARTRTNLRSDL